MYGCGCLIDKCVVDCYFWFYSNSFVNCIVVQYFRIYPREGLTWSFSLCKLTLLKFLPIRFPLPLPIQNIHTLLPIKPTRKGFLV